MKFIKSALVALLLILMIALLLGLPAAWARSGEDAAGGLPRGVRGRTGTAQDMAQILSVLGSQVEEGTLMDRTKEKLETLRNDDLRLIASLCERIPHNGENARADLAFLLAAALVVFS